MERTIERSDRLIVRFVDEIFFYSGQYALLYIIMNLSASVPEFFSEVGHVALLVLLPVQALLQAKYGGDRWIRFLGSFILPVSYTIQEGLRGIQYVLDMAHVFFWIFSLLLATLQTIMVSTASTAVKSRLEFVTTFLNVLTFLFLYLYFDLRASFEQQLSAGAITPDVFREHLEIYNLGSGVVEFVSDPTHVYVIVGGLVLGLILALGRVRVIELRDRIHALFGRYVDHNVRDRIIRSGGAAAERRELAVLFSDIRGFTSLSERHEAEPVARMLNHYFERWHRAATAHGGVVDKYIGDAVMILFGLETDGASAAAQAVGCATEMLESFENVRSELAADDLPVPSAIGIGINFGEVIVGDIGSPDRMDFTAVGDTVNVASRLETLTKSQSVPLIVSEHVYTLLPADAQAGFRLLGSVEIRGKEDRLRAYARDAGSIRAGVRDDVGGASDLG